MHPVLLSSLAAERRRDLAAGLRDHRVPRAVADGPGPARRWLPSFRVSWSRTSLSAATGRHRGRSWVIVISATRPL